MLTTLLSVGVIFLKCSLPFSFTYFNPSNISKPDQTATSSIQLPFIDLHSYGILCLWSQQQWLVFLFFFFFFFFFFFHQSWAPGHWPCSFVLKFQGASLFCWHSRSIGEQLKKNLITGSVYFEINLIFQILNMVSSWQSPTVHINHDLNVEDTGLRVRLPGFEFQFYHFKPDMSTLLYFRFCMSKMRMIVISTR